MQDMSGPENPEYQTFRERLAFLQPLIAETNLIRTHQKHVFEKNTSDLEKICKTWLENSRILISRPNQFPGYRSVMLFKSLFFNNTGHPYYHLNHFTLVTITSDGRLNTRFFCPATRETIYIANAGNKNASPLWTLSDNTFSASIEDAMKLLETDQNKWILMNINLDMHLSGIGFKSDPMLLFQEDYLWDSISESISGSIFFPQNKIVTTQVDKIFKYLVSRTQQDLKQARLAICNALDPDVVKTMHGTRLDSIREIKWLTGGDGVSSEIILARKQAVRAYPILTRHFLNIHSSTLRDAIDAKTSLSNAIGVYFNLDKAETQHKVKRLQGITWQRADANPYKTEHRIRDILEFPEGAVPKTQKQFRQLRIFKDFGQSVFIEGLCQTMERLSREGNPWNLVDRIEQTSGRNVDDAVDFLARKLHVPAILNKIGRIADHHGITPPRRLTQDDDNRFHQMMLEMATNAIQSSFKVRELLDWSDRYHRNIARYEDRLVTIDLEQDWPGISETIKCDHGHVARELTSAKALRTQGRVENHCVGGYLPSVLEGENNLSREIILIFSIEKNGKILSTAEIGCIRESCHSIDSETGRKTKTFQIKARVIENLARSNKAPSRDAVRIANQVAKQLEQIKPDAWKSYLDGLEHSKAEQDRISGIDSQIRNCGFDPFDRAMMERVWAELKPALPRSLRREKLNGFIDQSPINRRILDLMLECEQVDFYDRDKIDDNGRKIAQKLAREFTEEENFCP